MINLKPDAFVFRAQIKASEINRALHPSPKGWVDRLVDCFRRYFGSHNSEAKLYLEGFAEKSAEYSRAKQNGDWAQMRSAKLGAQDHFFSYRNLIANNTNDVGAWATHELDHNSPPPQIVFSFSAPDDQTVNPASKNEPAIFQFDYFNSSVATNHWENIKDCFDSHRKIGVDNNPFLELPADEPLSNQRRAMIVLDELYGSEKSPDEIFHGLEQLSSLAKKDANLFAVLPPGLTHRADVGFAMAECWNTLSPKLGNNSSRLEAMKILFNILSCNSPQKRISALEKLTQSKSSVQNLDEAEVKALIDAISSTITKSSGGVFFSNKEVRSHWSEIHKNFEGNNQPTALRILSRIFEEGRSPEQYVADLAELAMLKKTGSDPKAFAKLSGEGRFFSSKEAWDCWVLTDAPTKIPDNKKAPAMAVFNRLFELGKPRADRIADLKQLENFLGKDRNLIAHVFGDLIRIINGNNVRSTNKIENYFFDNPATRELWSSTVAHIAPEKIPEALPILIGMIQHKANDNAMLFDDLVELLKRGKVAANGQPDQAETQALFNLVTRFFSLFSTQIARPKWEALQGCFNPSDKASALQIMSKIGGAGRTPRENIVDLAQLNTLCCTPESRRQLFEEMTRTPDGITCFDKGSRAQTAWNAIHQHIPMENKVNAMKVLSDMLQHDITPEKRLEHLGGLMNMATLAEGKEGIFSALATSDSDLKLYLGSPELVNNWKQVDIHFAVTNKVPAMQSFCKTFESGRSTTDKLDNLNELIGLAKDAKHKGEIFQKMSTLVGDQYFDSPKAAQAWGQYEKHFNVENKPAAMNAVNRLHDALKNNSHQGLLDAFVALNQLANEQSKNVFNVQLTNPSAPDQAIVRFLVAGTVLHASAPMNLDDISYSFALSGLNPKNILALDGGNLRNLRTIQVYGRNWPFVSTSFDQESTIPTKEKNNSWFDRIMKRGPDENVRWVDKTVKNRAEAMKIFSEMSHLGRSPASDIRSFGELIGLADDLSKEKFKITVKDEGAGKVSVGLKIGDTVFRNFESVDILSVAPALLNIDPDRPIPSISESEKVLLAKVLATKCMAAGEDGTDASDAIYDAHRDAIYAEYRPEESASQPPVKLKAPYDQYLDGHTKRFTLVGDLGKVGRLFRDNLATSEQEKIPNLFGSMGYRFKLVNGVRQVQFRVVHPLLVRAFAPVPALAHAKRMGMNAFPSNTIFDNAAKMFMSFTGRREENLRPVLADMRSKHGGLLIGIGDECRNRLIARAKQKRE